MIFCRQLKLGVNIREAQTENLRCNILRKMIRKFVYVAVIVTLNVAYISSGLYRSSNYSKLCGAGVYLNVSAYRQVNVRTSLECVESCSRIQQCAGINYFSPARTCKLLFYNLTRSYNCRSLAVARQAARFYHKVCVFTRLKIMLSYSFSWNERHRNRMREYHMSANKVDYI